MRTDVDQPTDPLIWHLLVAAGFLALCVLRIGQPNGLYFDEIHYIPAARALLACEAWMNPEHPPLGKYWIAGGIAAFGDGPMGWRITSALAGAITLFAALRALWFANGSRIASLFAAILWTTGFALFVQSRIAMLDVFMLAFFAVAMWQCAVAMREPERGRSALAIAGIALGLSMASKWNSVPVAILPGLGFLAARMAAGRRRLLVSTRGWPVPGISLAEATIWLGAVPLLIYLATFLPSLAYPEAPLAKYGPFGLQSAMLELQQSVREPHPYSSGWWQWLLNLRAIWYHYGETDGIWRGVLLVGNPLTMLLGLPAIIWCLWAGITARRWDALAISILFVFSLGFWVLDAKPVQFYYHYLLPGMILLTGLALALERLWRAGWRWPVGATLASSAVLFAYFYPILSAAPLAGKSAFIWWSWLPGWV